MSYHHFSTFERGKIEELLTQGEAKVFGKAWQIFDGNVDLITSKRGWYKV